MPALLWSRRRVRHHSGPMVIRSGRCIQHSPFIRVSEEPSIHSNKEATSATRVYRIFNGGLVVVLANHTCAVNVCRIAPSISDKSLSFSTSLL